MDEELKRKRNISTYLSQTALIDKAFRSILVVPNNVDFWSSIIELSPGISLRYFGTFLFIKPNAPMMISMVLVLTF